MKIKKFFKFCKREEKKISFEQIMEAIELMGQSKTADTSRQLSRIIKAGEKEISLRRV